MRRVAADRTMGLLVLAIAPSFAVADDGPASSAPAPRLEGPGVSAAESQGLTAEPRPVPARTVPRLLAPRSPRPRIASAPAPAVSPAAEAPPLRPLVEVGTPAGDLPQALTIPDAPPLEGPAPLTLETVPDESALAPPLDSLEPLPPARPSSARDRDRDRDREDEDEDDEIDESIPSPPRRRGLLGRLRPSPPPPPPTRVESRRGDDPLGTRSDPAAEAALKRRVEAQVRVALGRHLRSVDVRVVGREVRIRARIDHFWNRRAAKRDLESLPALAGLRSQIEVE